MNNSTKKEKNKEGETKIMKNNFMIAILTVLLLVAVIFGVLFGSGLLGEPSEVSIPATSIPNLDISDILSGNIDVSVESFPDTSTGDESTGDVSTEIPDTSTGDVSTEPSKPDTSETVVTPPDTSEPEVSRPTYTGETWQVSGLSVRHLFTHCLIAYPELASNAAFTDCLTAPEWKKVLQSLYDNDFVLVDFNSIYDIYEEDGVEKAKMKSKITVPKGKKPLVISIDDVVYDPKKTNQGMVDKLVIRDNELWTYTLFKDGREEYSQDNEIFVILEDFIDKHPDFSYEGAKITLALTGFAGILGYRTDSSFAEQGYDVAKERKEAKVVADWLKAHGYTFASHSYAHGRMSNFSEEKTIRDCRKWKEEVASIVGDTNIFIYPYGDWPKYDTANHKALLDAGFKIFNGTSTMNYLINGFPGKGASVGNIFMDRFNVTGQTLLYATRQSDDGSYKFYDRMMEYYDPFEVYDNENRPETMYRPDDLQ